MADKKNMNKLDINHKKHKKNDDLYIESWPGEFKFVDNVTRILYDKYYVDCELVTEKDLFDNKKYFALKLVPFDCCDISLGDSEEETLMIPLYQNSYVLLKWFELSSSYQEIILEYPGSSNKATKVLHFKGEDITNFDDTSDFIKYELWPAMKELCKTLYLFMVHDFTNDTIVDSYVIGANYSIDYLLYDVPLKLNAASVLNPNVEYDVIDIDLSDEIAFRDEIIEAMEEDNDLS